MIKSEVYYSRQANQLVLLTPVYVEKEEVIEDDFLTYYDFIGLACDNNELILVLHPNAVKCFDYMGEL